MHHMEHIFTYIVNCLQNNEPTSQYRHDHCNELQLTNISCEEKRLHHLERLQGGLCNLFDLKRKLSNLKDILILNSISEEYLMALFLKRRCTEISNLLKLYSLISACPLKSINIGQNGHTIRSEKFPPSRLCNFNYTGP